MKIYLETNRVLLRELNSADENNLFELDSDPDVMKYLTGGIASTREEIRATLNRVSFLMKNYDGKLGIWAAVEKESNSFMGWFHLRPAKKDPRNLKRLELGYRLKKNFWGMGIATEVSKSLITKAFTELDANEVYATAMRENKASRKVMEKIGLTYSHDFYDENCIIEREMDVWYSLKKTSTAINGLN